MAELQGNPYTKSTISGYPAMHGILNRMPEPITKREQPIIDLMNEAVNIAELIHKTQHEPDENLSQLAISRKVLDLRETLAKFIFTAKIKINDIHQQEKEKLLNEADDLVSLKVDEYAQEIRSIFRKLDHSEKLQWLAHHIEQKNGAILAAILTVPAVLSGLTQAEVDRHREQYQSRAGNWGQLAHLNKVVDRVYAVLDAALLV